MKRPIFLSSLTLSVLLAASCNGTSYTYDASGTFEATEVVISAEANGKISSFRIEEGGSIVKDSVYGQIDTVQLSLQKRQIEAGMKAAAARLQDKDTYTASIRTQLLTQKKERERIRNLVAAKAANEKDLDDINSAIGLLETRLVSTEAQITQNNAAANAEILSLQVQREQVEDQLSRCRIVTPIDGTVLVKYAEEGELTGIGKPLFKVADIENMILRAYITAGQLTKIRLGQEVTVYADFGNRDSRQYRGRIAWISDKSEFTPKTIQTRDERANLVYAIKIRFLNDGYVKIGMYGDVKF